MEGRKQIFADYSYVDKSNVVDIVRNAMITHISNKSDIETLFDYYKSKQNILYKEREINTSINNKICVNHAHEIVSFNVGYIMGEPIQYIRRGDGVTVETINEINDIMTTCDKDAVDRDVAEWVFMCGQGYKMIATENTELKLYSLDPRYTFVVYENNLGNKPLLACTYFESSLDKIFYVYTDTMFYRIEGEKIVETVEHHIGGIPIWEYISENARLGSFEIVKTMLDAINMIESNRLDDIEQFVNYIMVILGGGSLEQEDIDNIKSNKLVALPEGCDIKLLSNALSQGDIQTFVDNLYEQVLIITGLPSRNASGGAGENGVAAYLKQGFSQAETRALAFEQTWKRSERKLLRVLVGLLDDLYNIQVSVKDIEVKFARRYTDSIQTKTQALIQLLDAGIAPQIAVATIGAWNDPYSVYAESKESLEARWNVRDYGQEVEETSTENMEQVS